MRYDSQTHAYDAQQDVFDYDFSRERVFLEIAAAEMQAKADAARASSTSSASPAREDESDDDLVKKVRSRTSRLFIGR